MPHTSGSGRPDARLYRHAILHWPVEELRGRFELRCEEADKDAADVLRDELGVDPDSDAFWARVKSNLQAGRIRMLFVADRIPPELRKVVEFMNVQMRPAEVLAVELRQYQGGGLRTLAPIVLGQTQEAIEQKSGAGAKPRRLWDEPRVLEALSAAGDAAVAATATAPIAWIGRRPIASCSTTRRAMAASPQNSTWVPSPACRYGYGRTAASPFPSAN